MIRKHLHFSIKPTFTGMCGNISTLPVAKQRLFCFRTHQMITSWRKMLLCNTRQHYYKDYWIKHVLVWFENWINTFIKTVKIRLFQKYEVYHCVCVCVYMCCNLTLRHNHKNCISVPKMYHTRIQAWEKNISP